jgi:prophage regulatory protein
MTKILRRPDVETATGLSRSSIYAAISLGEFPKPVRIGKRSVGWRESDILDWIDALKPRMVSLKRIEARHDR